MLQTSDTCHRRSYATGRVGHPPMPDGAGTADDVPCAGDGVSVSNGSGNGRVPSGVGSSLGVGVIDHAGIGTPASSVKTNVWLLKKNLRPSAD